MKIALAMQFKLNCLHCGVIVYTVLRRYWYCDVSPFISCFLNKCVRNEAFTSSPGAKWVTPDPQSTTTPDRSRPRINGNSLQVFITDKGSLLKFSNVAPQPPDRNKHTQVQNPINQLYFFYLLRDCIYSPLIATSRGFKPAALTFINNSLEELIVGMLISSVNFRTPLEPY